MAWSERREGELPLLNDSGGDLFCDPLSICGCQRQLSFGRIGEKAAFDQDSGQPAFAKHVIFGGTDSAVFSTDERDNLPLDAAGEHGAAIVFGIGFDAVRATSSRGIIMNANENCIGLRVGDRASHRKRNKNIGCARHYRAQSRSLQKFLQTQCRIQRYHFFRHTLAGNSSSIEPAVSRIDHNRRKRTVGTRVFGDHQKCDGYRDEKSLSKEKHLVFSKGIFLEAR
jgi:hypothetical protein